ncbi:hypothetical protein [Yoonia sp. I 8.24]|uniref:hypothetical protein n=1 Tax=Yoonia sp. I 8.24 TaxID=1537229 RepID=UPI001EDCDF3D|nr:hypothetical protein [Yoonia sp. I 8.24]MCG3268569.1 hypothetical protein [Yoonia sp. I 8.24]
MKLNQFGRAFMLALAVWIGSMGGVLAHALPDSTLIFAEDEDQISLTIQLALEDLTIAEPTLVDLMEHPVAQDIPAADVAVVARYFAQHLQIQNDDGAFSPTLAGVAIETAHNDHVGRYALLTLQYQFPASTSPLYLTYDAIMHEVRNQRAAVYWQESGSEPRIIEEFGYRPVDGMQQPIQLNFLSR